MRVFTEFEAKFFIDLDEFYQLLRQHDSQLIKSKTLMKRVIFKDQNSTNNQIRVRDEGDRITLSYKTYDPLKGIDSVQELELVINDFDKGCEMLMLLGLQRVRYVQNYREVYKLDDCLLMIDQWPFLPPIMEIEGDSQESVERVVKKLNFSVDHARFGPTARLYQEMYGVTQEQFEQISELTFESIPDILRSKR